MTNGQTNKESMFESVESKLDGRAAEIVTLMAGVDDAVLTFKNNIVTLRVKNAIQSNDLKGFTIQKYDYRVAMVDRAIDACNRTRSYALNNNLPILAAEVNQNKSDLMQMGETRCAAVCLNMQTKITAEVSHLAAYGVTDLMMTDLGTSIVTFNDFKPERRDNLNIQKEATSAIPVLIEANDLLLERVDASVRMLEQTHPEFYRAYFDAREIINTGGRTIALRVTVRDINGVVIEKVKFDIDDMKLKKRTTAKGNLQMKHLAAGPHTAKLSKYGYKSIDVAFVINDTERTDLEVVMDFERVEV